MKINSFLQISPILILANVIYVSGHSSNDQDNNSEVMDLYMIDMAQNSEGMRDVQDRTDDMQINGTISVNDSIIVSINVAPTLDMKEEMDEMMRHDSMMGDDNMMGEDYVNRIVVKISSLVEFTDQTNNGYTEDDTILSSFSLNITNLNEPVLVGNSMFVIKSIIPNLFIITFDLQSNDGVFYAFKWSTEINYNFTSNISKLAILHESSLIMEE